MALRVSHARLDKLSAFARVLSSTLAIAGLAWSLYYLPIAETLDDLRFVEIQFLQSKYYSPSSLTKLLESAPADLSPCESHAQTALLLTELKLAEADLRNGLTVKFDERIRSAKLRAAQALACAPRSSFIWLLAFNLEVLQGRINDASFAKFAMSYRTSPHESWIAVRRIAVGIPVLPLANDEIQKAVLRDFRQLILDGFTFEAASAFLAASAGPRAMLDKEIAELGPERADRFRTTLRETRR